MICSSFGETLEFAQEIGVFVPVVLRFGTQSDPAGTQSHVGGMAHMIYANMVSEPDFNDTYVPGDANSLRCNTAAHTHC
uniref:Uncharacterized protein n=1 Tax=Romanomermis culicivorax TaxID=13658 RepID=A0A915L8L1_ROMCU